MLKWSCRSEIWQAYRQQQCRGACQKYYWKSLNPNLVASSLHGILRLDIRPLSEKRPRIHGYISLVAFIHNLTLVDMLIQWNISSNEIDIKHSQCLGIWGEYSHLCNKLCYNLLHSGIHISFWMWLGANISETIPYLDGSGQYSFNPLHDIFTSLKISQS